MPHPQLPCEENLPEPQSGTSSCIEKLGSREDIPRSFRHRSTWLRACTAISSSSRASSPPAGGEGPSLTKVFSMIVTLVFPDGVRVSSNRFMLACRIPSPTFCMDSDFNYSSMWQMDIQHIINCVEFDLINDGKYRNCVKVKLYINGVWSGIKECNVSVSSGHQV